MIFDLLMDRNQEVEKLREHLRVRIREYDGLMVKYLGLQKLYSDLEGGLGNYGLRDKVSELELQVERNGEMKNRVGV